MSDHPATGTVPGAWIALQAHHNAAQVARDQIRNPAATPQMIDEATARFVRETDGIMAALDQLREQRWLGAITMFLAKKARS
jgi:hypothetical protein